MSFERAFHFFAYTTALWAFLMLAAFAHLHPPAIVAFLLAFALCLLRRRLGFEFSGTLWLIFSLLALGAAGYGWFVLREHLYSVVYLFLYLEINKLWTGERNRDFLQVFGLTFFQVLAAAVSTASVLFAPALAVYLFLMLGALITVTMKGDAERALSPSSARQRPQRPLIRRVAESERARLDAIFQRAYLTPRFCRRLGATLVAVVAIGMGLFFIIPRLQAQYFLGGLPSARASGTTSGFTDMVDFVATDDIRTNPEIVMRAIPERGYNFSNGQPDIDVLRLRGTALDLYDGRQWRKNPRFNQGATEIGLRRHVQLVPEVIPEHSPNRRVTTITLEPNRNGYLFGPDRPYRYRLESVAHIQVDYFSESLQLRASNWSIPIKYTVESDAEPAASFQLQRYSAEKDPLQLMDRAAQRVSTASMLAPLVRLFRPNEFGPFLQVPDHPDIRTVRSLAMEWTQHLDDPEQIALEIERRLKRDYQYSLQIEFASASNHLSRFLLTERRGHCEYFATAMTLMLRARGIPARLVNGYATDEWVASGGGYYIVRQEHAHSWVEAHLPDRGWVTFEPTPSNGIGGNRIPDTFYRQFSRWFDAMKLIWYNRVIDFNPSDQTALYARLLNLSDRIPRLNDVMQGGLRGLNPVDNLSSGSGGRLFLFLVVGAVLILSFFLVREILRLFRISTRKLLKGVDEEAANPRKVVPEYLDLLRAMEEKHERSPAETPLEFAHSVTGRNEALGDFLPLTRIYYDARFNGSTWTPRDTEKALVLLRVLSEDSTRSTAPRPSRKIHRMTATSDDNNHQQGT